MNEASDLIQKYADQIVDAVRNAAPFVWEAAVRKAWLDGLFAVIAGCLITITCGIVARRCRWEAKKHAEDMMERDKWTAGSIVALCVSVIGVMALLDGAHTLCGAYYWDAIHNVVGLARP